jgi:hypothetical protein
MRTSYPCLPGGNHSGIQDAQLGADVFHETLGIDVHMRGDAGGVVVEPVKSSPPRVIGAGVHADCQLILD